MKRTMAVVVGLLVLLGGIAFGQDLKIDYQLYYNSNTPGATLPSPAPSLHGGGQGPLRCDDRRVRGQFDRALPGVPLRREG